MNEISKEQMMAFLYRHVIIITREEQPEYDAIRALILAPPVTVTREWFRRLFEAMLYQEGTNEPQGIIQPVAKAMLAEKGIEVQP